MNVLKPGLIHEYTNYDTVAHCEAHIRCLETLDPAEGARLRAIAEGIQKTHGSIRGATYDLQRQCSALLDKLAPSGMYFGIPNVRSNMAGFWPRSWIEGETPRNPKGVPEATARQLGNAMLG